MWDMFHKLEDGQRTLSCLWKGPRRCNNSIVQHLQFKCPEKRFYALSKHLVCENMKLTTIGDVYHCVLGDGGEEISLDPKTMRLARRCIDNMLK